MGFQIRVIEKYQDEVIQNSLFAPVYSNVSSLLLALDSKIIDKPHRTFYRFDKLNAAYQITIDISEDKTVFRISYPIPTITRDYGREHQVFNPPDKSYLVEVVSPEPMSEEVLQQLTDAYAHITSVLWKRNRISGYVTTFINGR